MDGLEQASLARQRGMDPSNNSASLARKSGVDSLESLHEVQVLARLAGGQRLDVELLAADDGDDQLRVEVGLCTRGW